MIKLVDIYVGRSALYGLLAVWLILTILFLISGFFSELRSVKGGYGTVDALWFLTQITPRMAYKIFPVSALLGALLGVGGLAATNELVAFRAAGVSRIRLALAALAGTLLITIPVVMMGEWIAPAAEQQARAFRLSEMTGQAAIGGRRGMWLRDGEDIVNIQRPLMTSTRGEQTVSFNKIVIYQFSGERVLQTITRAEKAIDTGEGWVLENVNEVKFVESGAVLEQSDQKAWQTEIKPQLLDSAVTRPSLLSLRSLWTYIEFLGDNGLDDRIYWEAFWERALYPFTVMALVLAGMPFVFGSARSQSTGVRMFSGMIVGGLYVLATDAFEQVGSFLDFPIVIFAALPPLLLASVSIVILRRSV